MKERQTDRQTDRRTDRQTDTDREVREDRQTMTGKNRYRQSEENSKMENVKLGQ